MGIQLTSKEEYNGLFSSHNKDGRSALLVACINGCFNAVKLLVENNANIFLKNNVCFI